MASAQSGQCWIDLLLNGSPQRRVEVPTEITPWASAATSCYSSPQTYPLCLSGA